MSVKQNNFPLEIDFEIFVVVWATYAISVLVPTAIPMNGAATLTVGFGKIFQADFDALKELFC